MKLPSKVENFSFIFLISHYFRILGLCNDDLYSRGNFRCSKYFQSSIIIRDDLPLRNHPSAYAFSIWTVVDSGKKPDWYLIPHQSTLRDEPSGPNIVIFPRRNKNKQDTVLTSESIAFGTWTLFHQYSTAHTNMGTVRKFFLMCILGRWKGAHSLCLEEVIAQEMLCKEHPGKESSEEKRWGQGHLEKLEYWNFMKD